MTEDEAKGVGVVFLLSLSAFLVGTYELFGAIGVGAVFFVGGLMGLVVVYRKVSAPEPQAEKGGQEG